MTEALSCYGSRFVMPENLIADTMSEIVRRRERRAYIRGLLIASAAVVVMIACAVGLIVYLAVVTPEPFYPADIPIGNTVAGISSVMKGIFSAPIVLLMIGCMVILLLLDYLVRSRMSAHGRAEMARG